MLARSATPADAAAIARIYNQGIADRMATFETAPRSAADVGAWFDGRHPIVLVEDAGAAIAFAATFDYRPRRPCYAGIAEFSVYVERAARGRGAGRLAMQALLAAAEAAGFWKLVSPCLPREHGQPGAAARPGLPHRGRLRKARPARRPMARCGDRRAPAAGQPGLSVCRRPARGAR